MNLGKDELGLKVDPRTLDWVGCNGEAKIFDSAVVFKRLPALLSPSGKEEYLPMEVVVCKECGKIPEFIHSQIPDLPDHLKSSCNAKKPSGLQL